MSSNLPVSQSLKKPHPSISEESSPWTDGTKPALETSFAMAVMSDSDVA
jgi:hypothetical protein